MRRKCAACCVRRRAPFEVGLQSLSSFLAGFFVPGFPKLQRFQTHHDQIVSKLLPRLKKHLVGVPMQQTGGVGCGSLCTGRPVNRPVSPPTGQRADVGGDLQHQVVHAVFHRQGEEQRGRAERSDHGPQS